MQHLIRHSEISEQGPKHATNDDSFSAASELRLYVVCDGVSGHSGGNVASRLAVDTVNQVIRQKLAGGAYPTIQEAAVMARDAIVKASQVIFERALAEPALQKMATTIALAWQVGEHLLCAHTGDSRVYLWRRGKLQRLTKDHSFVQEMVESGEMTEEEAKKSQYAHALVHAVGIQPTARVDLLAPEVQEGDMFLICTDGIYGGCNDAQIATVLARAPGNLQSATKELLKGARAGGSVDDATAILLTIGEALAKPAPPAIPTTRPPMLPSQAVPPQLNTATPPPLGQTPPPLSVAKPPPLSPAAPPPLPAPAATSAGRPAAPGPAPYIRPAAPLPQDKLNALDLSPFFGELSFTDKTRLLEISKQKYFPPGHTLAREGEIADQLWVLISGKVRLTERGTVVIERSGPLTLGEAALMEQEPRSATIVVLEDAHVLEFERARVLAFFAPHMQNPAAQLYRAIATLEHKRMRELTHQLADKEAAGKART